MSGHDHEAYLMVGFAGLLVLALLGLVMAVVASEYGIGLGAVPVVLLGILAIPASCWVTGWALVKFYEVVL